MYMMVKYGMNFHLLSFYSSEHAAHMAHWPVKKSKAVLTGLWKLCARMLRRIVNDNLGDNPGDTAHAWLSTKFLPLTVPRQLHYREVEQEVTQEVVFEGVIGRSGCVFLWF